MISVSPTNTVNHLLIVCFLLFHVERLPSSIDRATGYTRFNLDAAVAYCNINSSFPPENWMFDTLVYGQFSRIGHTPL
jgi:hypothetical protein